MVMVAAGSRTDCPNWRPDPDVKNAYLVKKPALEDQICMVSTIPKGYVITSQSGMTNCPNWMPPVPWLPGMQATPNSVRIKAGGRCRADLHDLARAGGLRRRGARPPLGLPVANPFPANFNTTTVKRPGAVETVCLESAIPPGYTIISGANSSACPATADPAGNDSGSIPINCRR